MRQLSVCSEKIECRVKGKPKPRQPVQVSKLPEIHAKKSVNRACNSATASRALATANSRFYHLRGVVVHLPAAMLEVDVRIVLDEMFQPSDRAIRLESFVDLDLFPSPRTDVFTKFVVTWTTAMVKKNRGDKI